MVLFCNTSILFLASVYCLLVIVLSIDKWTSSKHCESKSNPITLFISRHHSCSVVLIIVHTN
uniref:Uncharacterized protein n=1 Tax=Arundo donax TaxID=35708 RepID=A0A0A9HC83_ARUDO